MLIVSCSNWFILIFRPYIRTVLPLNNKFFNLKIKKLKKMISITVWLKFDSELKFVPFLNFKLKFLTFPLNPFIFTSFKSKSLTMSEKFVIFEFKVFY